MANRTGTYFAFDGLGETDPTKSDFRYYTTVKAWSEGKNIDFRFVNSHDKASAVRDTSLRTTLEASIRKRLAASKNVVVILSTDTRKTGSMLSYEIEKAVDTYQLPLICAIVGRDSVLSPSAYSGRWPNSLANRINNKTATAIHIPFRKNPLLSAIERFTVHSSNLTGPLNHYTANAHESFGL